MRAVWALMMDRLRQELAGCDQVGEVRGRGFMQGVEFVEDRQTKRHAVELRDRIVMNCVFEQKLWVLSAGRSAIRLSPALITDEEQAMEAVTRFVRAVEQETAALKALHVVAAASPYGCEPSSVSGYGGLTLFIVPSKTVQYTSVARRHSFCFSLSYRSKVLIDSGTSRAPFHPLTHSYEVFMSRFFALFSLACAGFGSVFVSSAHAAGVSAQPMVQVMVQLKGSPLAADSNLKARTAATLHRFRLDATLPSARWYSNALVRYQNQELSYLHSQGLDIRLNRQFHVLFNGFSATIPVGEESRLRRLNNVVGVLPVKQYRPLVDGSVNLVHANEAWSQVGSPSNAGRGLMIANIDTGIDVKNPCFNDAGFAPPPLGRRSDNPADLALTNNKVIVARAFGSDPTARYSAADSQGHGTFNAAIEACDYNTVTPIGTHMSGMAPAAYLMNYNVFVDNGGTTTDSDILAGVEAALLDGADVANISIGGPAGDPSLDFESQELDLASKAGLTMVVAAGNDGPSTQTVSSPGVAASAIAVGATTNSRGIFSSASVTGVDGIPSQLAHMRANQGHAFTTKVGPAQMVPVGLGRLPQDDTNDLTANDFAGKDLHGKIALIQRGTITFEKKINNAAAAGAIGALVYDNVPEVSLLHMATASATLPAMSISQADGQALVAFLQTNPSAEVTFDPSLTAADETPNLLSDFSSRGFSANYNIKPDLVAPGEDIYSATEAQDPAGSQYDPSGFMSGSGTSFSSPHVAGSAALVLQKHPTWTPEQVKAALVEHANPSVVIDPQTKATPSVTQMGGGLLDASAALSATALATPDVDHLRRGQHL